MARTNSRGGLTGLVIRIAINAVALWVAAQVIPGISFSRPDDIQTILLVALIFGVVDALIKPLTLFLTCLINVITLGLFTLVINAGMLWLTSEIALQILKASFHRGRPPGALVADIPNVRPGRMGCMRMARPAARANVLIMV